MVNDTYEFICDRKGCGKPATRVLRYFVDGAHTGALDPKTERFCDTHAAEEEKSVLTPGTFFYKSVSDGTREEAFVHEFSNSSIEDFCCSEETEDGKVAVRIGKNVDPTLWGYAPETRGTTLVRPTGE